MEKLSPEGKSSLLSSLSKLLGKKKELQDLELTVRTQGKGRRCRGTWRWGSWGRSPRTWQMASGQRSRQWVPSPRLVKCPPLRLPGLPLRPASLWRWANSAGSQAGQQASRTFFWRGAQPFFSRVQDSGTKEPKSLILFRT